MHNGSHPSLSGRKQASPDKRWNASCWLKVPATMKPTAASSTPTGLHATVQTGASKAMLHLSAPVVSRIETMPLNNPDHQNRS